jgi:hypothetical protein
VSLRAAVYSLLVFGLLLGPPTTTAPAQASHGGPCTVAPVTSPEINALAENPPGLQAPASTKGCVQDLYNRNGWDTIATMWLNPDSFNVPVGTPTVNATLYGANVHMSSSPANSIGVTMNVTDTKVDWPMQDGFFDASNVMTFTSGSSYNLGNIPRGSSTGASRPVTINTSNLRPGRNLVTIFFDATFVFPPGISCSPPGAVPGTCTDSAAFNIYIDYNPIVPPPDFSLQPFFSGGNAPGPGQPIQAGKTYTIGVNVRNGGAAPSEDVALDVKRPAELIDPSGGNPAYNARPPGQQPGDYTGYGYHWLCGAVNTPACSSPHWWWARSAALPSGGVWSGQFEFTVESGLPGGTPVCLDGYAYFVNRAHNPAYAPAQVCWIVENPLHPFLTTSRGDVHAGGGIGIGVNCDAVPGSNKRVQGQQAGGSRVQYVLSAGADIKNFAAGQFLGDAPAGFYGVICRPDLVRFAETYRVKPGNPVVSLPNDVALAATLASTVAGTDRLVYRNVGGGEAVIDTGALPTVISGRVTLYVNGNVRIKSNILYQGAGVTRQNLPAFGIIATGDIRIDNSVTQLDGYYFAGNGGTIDTCANQPDVRNNPNDCRNNLRVRGLMMATGFRWARTGNGSGPVEAERIDFLGDLYLSTPPAFRDVMSARVSRPRNQGERPPLY